MWQNLAPRSSFTESIKALEADVHHANSLAASLPSDCRGKFLRMKLNYSPFAPLFLHLIEWMNLRCTDGLPSFLGLLHVLVFKVRAGGMASKARKATLREFYAVIYPSLRQLRGEAMEIKTSKNTTRFPEIPPLSNEAPDREEECGICFEICTKIALPTCGHSMCITCFHDWNGRAQSCPFCRGSLERIASTDLWILPASSDLVDRETIGKENLSRFYLYIDHLPLVLQDTRACML